MFAKTTATKLLASVALVAGAAGVAGLGTFGEFTDSTTATQQADAGWVELTNAETTNLSQAVAGLVPGDTVDRAITLTRADRSELFGKVSLAVTADNPASPLVGGNNYASGLQLVVDSCSNAWTPSSANAKVLECVGGSTTTVVPAGAVLRPNGALPAAVTEQLNATKNSHLRVRLSLPALDGVTDNTLQGATAKLSFAFTAHQRVGTAQ